MDLINSPSCINKDWTRHRRRTLPRPPYQRRSLPENAPVATDQRRSSLEDAQDTPIGAVVARGRTTADPHSPCLARSLLSPEPHAPDVASTTRDGYASCDCRRHPRLTWPPSPPAPLVAAAATTKVDRATAVANGASRGHRRRSHLV